MQMWGKGKGAAIWSTYSSMEEVEDSSSLRPPDPKHYFRAAIGSVLNPSSYSRPHTKKM